MPLGFLMPGEIAVRRDKLDKIRRQQADVQSILGLDTYAKMEEEFRLGYMINDKSTNYHAGFYDGMLWLLMQIKQTREKWLSENRGDSFLDERNRD